MLRSPICKLMSRDRCDGGEARPRTTTMLSGNDAADALAPSNCRSRRTKQNMDTQHGARCMAGQDTCQDAWPDAWMARAGRMSKTHGKTHGKSDARGKTHGKAHGKTHGKSKARGKTHGETHGKSDAHGKTHGKTHGKNDAHGKTHGKTHGKSNTHGKKHGKKHGTTHGKSGGKTHGKTRGKAHGKSETHGKSYGPNGVGGLCLLSHRTSRVRRLVPRRTAKLRSLVPRGRISKLRSQWSDAWHAWHKRGAWQDASQTKHSGVEAPNVAHNPLNHPQAPCPLHSAAVPAAPGLPENVS